MSRTSTTASTALRRLDAAFGRVRRLWDSPQLKRRFVARLGTVVEPAVVRTLRAAEELGPDAGIGAVADALGVDASTASRLVEQTVAHGFLTRDTSSADRRRTVLRLTPSGWGMLRRATRVREELLADLTAGWTDDEIQTLADLLERLAQRVAELENPQ